MDGMPLSNTSSESPPPKKKAESSLENGKALSPMNANNSNNNLSSSSVLGGKQELVDKEKYQSPQSRERRLRERSSQRDLSVTSQRETKC